MKTIIILGGGIQTDVTLPNYVKERCDIGISIYKNEPNNYNFITTSAATYHSQLNLNEEGQPIYESIIIAKYLVDNGIPSNKIYREWNSFDTIGNIFFLKVNITDIRKWYDLIVITSDFHMERSKIICDFIFPLSSDNLYNLTYIQTNHSNIDPNILSNRLLKEANSIKKFNENMLPITNLSQLHEWLYNHHDCYTALTRKQTDKHPKLLYG